MVPVPLLRSCPGRLGLLQISVACAGRERARVRRRAACTALPDVWIRPPFGGKGRKVTGQLEAHANGFRYTSPKGEQLDIMYRCAVHRV